LKYGKSNQLPLRIITAGSVDDGKSTLIGRMLYDTASLYSDQIAELERISSRTNSGLNLAYITDGLRHERQQGITIDIGYRYFMIGSRKIILADTPGHLEYTGNMIAAASNAEAAVILVDASRTITEQTRRHIILAHLMGITHIIICINKIDLAGYSQSVFETFRSALLPLVNSLKGLSVVFIPVSALYGDNVVNPSDNTPWYGGQTLVNILEALPNNYSSSSVNCFSVQCLIHDPVGNVVQYAGRTVSGSFQTGGEIFHIPSLKKAVISKITLGEKEITYTEGQLSSAMVLQTPLTISRGDLFVGADEIIHLQNKCMATLCWLGKAPLNKDKEYIFQHSSKRISCRIASVESILDISTYEPIPARAPILQQHEIGTVEIELSEPLYLKNYSHHKLLGSAIIIDPETNDTAGAVLITDHAL
jgi:sulfate adenylyltransferase subunit 1